MKISILCSDQAHPVYSVLQQWAAIHRSEHDVRIVTQKADLQPSDILFLISCHEVICKADREQHGVVLVVHASDLPLGRGWSPHVWQVIEGKTSIVVSLLEAEDKVDTGKIWYKIRVNLPKHLVYDEINQQIFDATMQLMDYAIHNKGSVVPEEQDNSLQPTYFRKRTPEDSELDTDASIASQFDKMRVADPERYPAYFKIHDHVYTIRIEKVKNET